MNENAKIIKNLPECQIKSHLKYNPKITYIYWTGGYDSTFRICQALLDENRKVQPIYIIDLLDDKSYLGVQRVNRQEEIKAMNHVRKIIKRDYPARSKDLLPTIYAQVPPDSNFTKRFTDLNLYNRKYNQYETLSRWSWLNKCPTELGITDFIKTDSELTYPRVKFKEYLYRRLDSKYHNRLDKQYKDSPFYYMIFPIGHMSKDDMLEVAINGGYDYILNNSWSCWKPVKTKAGTKPCGKCQMCQERILDHDPNQTLHQTPYQNQQKQPKKIYHIRDTDFKKYFTEYLNQNQDQNQTCIFTNKYNPRAYFSHNYGKICHRCEITMGFDNVEDIADKGKLAKKLRGRSYHPETYPFHRNNYYTVLSKLDNNKLWIVKPCQGKAQKGIYLIKSHDDLIRCISPENTTTTTEDTWVLQKYIENPMLINHKKFHFRVYALIHRTPEHGLKTYLYPKGYLYIADDTFDLNGESFKQPLLKRVHLTTSCNNQEYPRCFANSQNYTQLYDKIILPQLKFIVKDTISVFKDRLTCPNERSCYKLLGYDIIADQTGKLHLLEINARHVGMPERAYYGKCSKGNIKPKLHTPKFKKDLTNHMLNIVIRGQNTGFYELQA